MNTLPASVCSAAPTKNFENGATERTRQEIGDIQLFLLPMQICQQYRRVFAKLPNDLPASSARRRELLGVGNDYQSGKVSLAFRERFPDRYPLGANGQAVARAFDIATREHLALVGLQRRAHQKL